MKTKKQKKAEVLLEYAPAIEPPMPVHHLHQQACSNDHVTVESWRKTWIGNIRENMKRFDFAAQGVGLLYNSFKNLPCIVAGSGPSLKCNAHLLKDRGDKIGLISCLHNFHLMEDLEARVDFYTTLDAGPVTIEEVSEGGTKTADEYWALTKSKTLLAYIGTDPKLLEKWQGEVYFFNCPVPDADYARFTVEEVKFFTFVGTGGNVLGASMYLAKAYFGANPIVYIGADFSFGISESNGELKQRFHAWDSKYDKDMGVCLRAFDIYGNTRKTWPSYMNFKSWFDEMAIRVPGLWINCTEGGCLGAYPQGIIRQMLTMDLEDLIEMYNCNAQIAHQCNEPRKEAMPLMLF